MTTLISGGITATSGSLPTATFREKGWLVLTRQAGESILIKPEDREPIVLTLLGTTKGDFLLLASSKKPFDCKAHELQQSEKLKGGKVYMLNRGVNLFSLCEGTIKMKFLVHPESPYVEGQFQAPRDIKIMRMEVTK